MAEVDSSVVVDVSAWAPLQEEQLGSRQKMWLVDGAKQAWLWKSGRESARLPEPGADLWAEVIAACAARGLGVPAAPVCFATWDGRAGVISRRVADDLVHGNELLYGQDPSYQLDRVGAVPGYDLPTIRRALGEYRGAEPGLSAWESFAGLMVLDGLITNTDRHHENWAVVESSGQLAPSYDHGASLGFNVPPARRSDLGRVIRHGRARHFPGRPTPVDLAHRALGQVTPQARGLWMSRIEALDMATLDDEVASVPADRMSGGARTFVEQLLRENRRRLLT